MAIVGGETYRIYSEVNSDRQYADLAPNAEDPPAGQRQQPLGFLDVIHRLFGRLGVGLVSSDSGCLLQLFPNLLQTWVVDLGCHLVQPLQGVVRLFLNVLRLVGVVDLAFLAGVEVAPALERPADGRD